MMAKTEIRRSFRWLAHLAGVALLVAAAYASAQPQATEAIVVEQSPSLVTFVGGTTKAAGRLKVRIDGPNGQTVYESASEAGILDWVPDATLPNGRYRWDAWFVPQSAANQLPKRPTIENEVERTTDYRSGSFQLEGGSLVVPEDDVGERASLSWPERALGVLLDAVVPPAAAQVSHSETVTLTDDDTNSFTGIFMESDGAADSGICNVGGNLLFFIDDNCLLGSQEMTLQVGTGRLGVGVNDPAVPLHIGDSVPRLRFEDTNDDTAWTVSASADEFRLQDNAGGSRPFIIDSGTDTDGAPINSLFIESPTGDIGMGTSTPQKDIHVSAAAPGLRLDNTGLGGGSWDVQVGSSNGSFFISDVAESSTPFGISTGGAPTFSLWLSATGNVGMGTSSPSKQLHVQGSDSLGGANNSVQLKVSNNSGTSTRRDMLTLENSGEPKFVLSNTDNGETWDFSARTDGFNINLLGTGGPELRVAQTGFFQISSFGNSTFTIGSTGKVFMTNDVLVEGTVVHSSSRDVKKAVTPVDHQVVLDKLGQLEVTEWSYKKDAGGDRHLSPMAEDFHAAFGLGPDNRHVAPSDLAGVALAAAKALKHENEALRKELATLKAAVAELKTVSR